MRWLKVGEKGSSDVMLFWRGTCFIKTTTVIPRCPERVAVVSTGPEAVWLGFKSWLCPDCET